MRGLHHVAIQCADLESCERFYRDVLELPVLRRWPRPGGGDRSVWLSVGEGFLALERADGSCPPAAGEPQGEAPWRDGAPGPRVVALGIAPGERAAWEARLAARGVPVAHRTRFTIYLRDPEGNRIGLSHWPFEWEAP